MSRASICVASLLIGLAGSLALAGENGGRPVSPYVDPMQLDVPWPKHSDYRQPWRAFLETRDGADFLRGIGVNYNVPGHEELAVRLLAETGFRAFRIEVGWGSVKWDESGLTSQAHLSKLLKLCKRYGIRPTLLLNANHGAPCPMKTYVRRLAEDAPAGARSVRLTDVSDLSTGYCGLSNLGPHSYWAAEAIFTKIDPRTGECALSRPIPVAMKKGESVNIARLKYQPLYPVGTPQFDETANGWVRYAERVASAASEAGIDDFDVELWNELSFGSNFTDVNRYYDPPLLARTPNFLLPGGSAWELSRRTIADLKKAHPHVRVIWGWSNTTFYHCPIPRLPPGTDGQSYHPYGTGTRTLPKDEDQPNHPEFNIDGYVPHLTIRMPEGWAHEFLKTECLMRLLNPTARKQKPPGTQRFYQYMTEHGVAPPECGVTDDAGSWRLKTMCALRSYCLWLNKGVDALDYFCAYDKSAEGMGLLPPNLSALPADARFDEVATPPMRAIRNLTRVFADGAAPIPPADRKPLAVDVAELDGNRETFAGDGKYPPLYERQSFAFLPWQTAPGRYVAAVYVMTYDATRPMPETRYRLTITAPGAGRASVRLYDPVLDKPIDVHTIESKPGEWEIEAPMADYPRLLTIQR